MLENREIMERIPHAFPFVFVDRVLHLEKGVRGVAIKNVTVNERFFLGHFPGNPLLPGVLILESLAQLGGIIIGAGEEEAEEKSLWVLAEILNVRFRRPVVPGDQLILTVTVDKILGNAARFSGKAVAGEHVAAEGEFTLARVVDPKESIQPPPAD
ncbi:MAG: 3-hydroxyacyl-ACP dehydratase FabZ [Planctomycetota bacterium]|jgi:3-hydroxyacyl-[acyl-carrier-protein] dehydratase